MQIFFDEKRLKSRVKNKISLTKINFLVFTE